MTSYILSIHQKTAGTWAVILDHKANVVASAFAEITQYFPHLGWVEHDADEIWRISMKVVAEALRNGRIAPEQIDAIGITNQRDTTVFWNKKTSEPVGRAIVWQDQRTRMICEQLIAKDKINIETRTGMVIVPDVTAAKIRWLMDNDMAIQKGIARGELLCGTIDSWLIWKLSGGTAHVTDHSNASLTLLLNSHSLTYDDEMLNELGIPREILPGLRRSSEIYTYTDPEAFFGVKVPIGGAGGDQQIAVFGQACVEAGMAKNTYSTGSFVLFNTGNRFLPPAGGLFSPVLWTMDETVMYGLEGKADVSGDLILWLQDGLGILHEVGDADGLASQVTDTQGVYFVPPFAGSDMVRSATDSYSRGAILGVTREITKHHIVRAALEALAYQTRDFIEAIRKREQGPMPRVLRADGNIAKSDFLLQFQADILGIPVERPVFTDTAAIGAAYMAGLAVGYWRTVGEVVECWKRESYFEPRLSEERREELYYGWQRALKQVKSPF
ncbi:MAG: glycerol kinase GlpK [Anaerolineales bacterium]